MKNPIYFAIAVIALCLAWTAGWTFGTVRARVTDVICDHPEFQPVYYAAEVATCNDGIKVHILD